MPPLKLWLLDADVAIDLLSLGIFDKLVKLHDVSVCSTVINEVKFYRKGGNKVAIDFRKRYVESGEVKEYSSSIEELEEILSRLTPIQLETLHSGELESLAVLAREEKMTFCSCDAATIRALPFLDLSDRGISVEVLLRQTGLLKSALEEKHKDEYFKNNLAIGRKDMIYNFGKKK